MNILVGFFSWTYVFIYLGQICYGKVLYWVNRYTVVSASHGILLRNKKEWTPDTYGVMEESKKYITMSKRGQPQKSSFCMILFIESSRSGAMNLWWEKSGQWLPLAGEDGPGTIHRRKFSNLSGVVVPPGSLHSCQSLPHCTLKICVLCISKLCLNKYLILKKTPQICRGNSFVSRINTARG